MRKIRSNNEKQHTQKQKIRFVNSTRISSIDLREIKKTEIGRR